MEIDWVRKWMRPRLHLVVDLVRKPFNTITCDATALPLRDETVDVAIAWHVLEHILDDVGVMREIKRVLKRDGQILMSVPTFPPGRPTTYEDRSLPRERYREVHGHRDHVRSPGLDYGDRFLDSHFSMERLDVGDLASIGNEGDLMRFGLGKNHVAWHFRKV